MKTCELGERERKTSRFSLLAARRTRNNGGCSRSWELVGQALSLAGMAPEEFEEHSYWKDDFHVVPINLGTRQSSSLRGAMRRQRCRAGIPACHPRFRLIQPWSGTRNVQAAKAASAPRASQIKIKMANARLDNWRSKPVDLVSIGCSAEYSEVVAWVFTICSNLRGESSVSPSPSGAAYIR